jgi:hypothetical protein
VETQFSIKIKKLKTNNGGEYINKVITAFLEIKGIIYDLSLPYAHKSNGLPEHINRTIVTMIRSMTLDCADVISQALWAEGVPWLYILSTAYYIMLLNLNNCHVK